jgi:hypothetical protein
LGAAARLPSQADEVFPVLAIGEIRPEPAGGARRVGADEDMAAIGEQVALQQALQDFPAGRA